MQLVKLELKNFRCFEKYTLDVSNKLVLIEGGNGVGKTTLLEALHYLCYMRSFRSHSPRELVQFEHDSFFIKAHFFSSQDAQEHEIQVGFSGKKKLVKINQKPVDSYKELLGHYRIVAVSENDLDLISGGPDCRRTFIDHTLMLEDAHFLILSREIKSIVDQRTAFFASGSYNAELYSLWTEQLWQKTALVQQQRTGILQHLQVRVQELMESLALPYTIGLTYVPKKGVLGSTFTDFMEAYPDLYEHERRAGYTLFGAHLDDISITLQSKKSKLYASRGQQKLIVLLLKIAQLSVLDPRGVSPIFLLDDFMTDFDEKVSKVLLDLLLSLKNQLIFTAPTRGFLGELLHAHGADRIVLGER